MPFQYYLFNTSNKTVIPLNTNKKEGTPDISSLPTSTAKHIIICADTNKSGMLRERIHLERSKYYTAALRKGTQYFKVAEQEILTKEVAEHDSMIDNLNAELKKKEAELSANPEETTEERILGPLRSEKEKITRDIEEIRAKKDKLIEHPMYFEKIDEIKAEEFRNALQTTLIIESRLDEFVQVMPEEPEVEAKRRLEFPKVRKEMAADSNDVASIHRTSQEYEKVRFLDEDERITEELLPYKQEPVKPSPTPLFDQRQHSSTPIISTHSTSLEPTIIPSIMKGILSTIHSNSAVSSLIKAKLTRKEDGIEIATSTLKDQSITQIIEVYKTIKQKLSEHQAGCVLDLSNINTHNVSFTAKLCKELRQLDPNVKVNIPSNLQPELAAQLQPYIHKEETPLMQHTRRRIT